MVVSCGDPVSIAAVPHSLSLSLLVAALPCAVFRMPHAACHMPAKFACRATIRTTPMTAEHVAVCGTR